MIRITDSRSVISDEVTYVEYAGKSTDQKPTTFGQVITIVNGERVMKDVAIATGSTFLEVDTGDVYAWDETGSTWHKIASLGGDA